jgi:hypothetical protein
MANERNAAVAIFDYPNEAEAAIKELHRAGIDLKKLSIVGKDFKGEDLQVEFLVDRRAHRAKSTAELLLPLQQLFAPATVSLRSLNVNR